MNIVHRRKIKNRKKKKKKKISVTNFGVFLVLIFTHSE